MARPRLRIVDGGEGARPGRADRPLLVHVIATRPDAVTLAPVHAALERRGDFSQYVVLVGAHTRSAIVEDVMRDAGLVPPDRTLAVGHVTPGAQTARALAAAERLLNELEPAAVLVSGDSNPALGFALAAAKCGTAVARVEAGLREHDLGVSEEINRILLDRVADLLFAPTAHDAAALESEGISGGRVYVVGSTAVDSLRRGEARAARRAVWRRYGLERGAYVLATLGHSTNVDDDERLARIVEGMASLAERVPVVLPLHPRTRERLKPMGDVHRLLAAGVLIKPPLPYLDFVSLQIGAGAVVTDSGVVQEEASALGVGCFTLRSTTERVTTLTHGTNQLLGDDLRDIRSLTTAPPVRPPRAVPGWDGRAGERIAAALTANYAIVPAVGTD